MGNRNESGILTFKHSLPVSFELSTGSRKHEVLTPRHLSFLTFPVHRLFLFVSDFLSWTCGCYHPSLS